MKKILSIMFLLHSSLLLASNFNKSDPFKDLENLDLFVNPERFSPSFYNLDGNEIGIYNLGGSPVLGTQIFNLKSNNSLVGSSVGSFLRDKYNGKNNDIYHPLSFKSKQERNAYWNSWSKPLSKTCLKRPAKKSRTRR
jgi:hypothetical protein